MTSRRSEAPEAALLPLFQGRRGCNLSFVLDSSEKMRVALEAVKRLLIQTLLTKASLRDSLFNIMTFSGKVSCWSDHMLPCTADTVYTSLSWIHSITCSPGRDLLAALSMALTDPVCQAVHLLSADLPDQPESVLRALPALAGGKPVNIFYLLDSEGQLDSDVRDYLQCLTRTTRGSCYMIPVSPSGVLHKLIPLDVSPVACRCPSASVGIPQQHNSSSPLFRRLLSPVTSCVLSGQTLACSEFFPGCRVLARRETDGFYHLGKLIQQMEGRRGVWLVEFDHPGSASFGVVSSRQQLVCSLDMLKHTRAHTPCLAHGDAVLSPWEPDLKRYGPGAVMGTAGHGNGFRADASTKLRVLMWNHCVSLVPGSLVLPISASHHDRIVRELRIQTSSAPSFSCDRSSSCTPRLFSAVYRPSDPACCCCSISNHWPWTVPRRCRSSLEDRRERDKQVDNRDADVRVSDPEATSSISSYPSEDHYRATDPPAVEQRSKHHRPPWRYWRRTGSEPQHKQPGSSELRRPSPPARFSLSAPQISASPNHSSLFQSLPGPKGRRVNVKRCIWNDGV